jgi:hypothetical protein
MAQDHRLSELSAVAVVDDGSFFYVITPNGDGTYSGKRITKLNLRTQLGVPAPGASGTAPVSNGSAFVNTGVATQAELAAVITTVTAAQAAADAAQGDIDTHEAHVDPHTQYILADGSRALAGALSLGGFRLMDGAAPVAGTDLVTKDFVTAAVASGGGQSAQFTGLVSGGGVVWESAYTFRVSAAVYFIRGTQYSSAEQTITLDAADATLDRIDVLALDTAGALVKITGTPAAQPSEPDVDPSTQLKLTFVLVVAASTQPPGVSNESVYLENTEWTSSTSGSGWNANSTNNPRTSSKTIEGTSLANGAYVQLQRASSTALDSFAVLQLFVRSKATWPTSRTLRLQFFLSGVAKGTPVTLASGYWGFNSAVTGSYQLVAIPLAQFSLPAGVLVNQLRLTVNGTGGTLGMYVDDIVLQSRSTSLSTPVAGLTQEQADARYVQRVNDRPVLTFGFGDGVNSDSLEADQTVRLPRLPSGSALGFYVDADAAGSCVIDIQSSARTPTSWASICGAEKPTLSSADHAEDVALAWTAFDSSKKYRAVLESVSGLTQVAVGVEVLRS